MAVSPAAESRRCALPELTASAPVRRLGTRRDVIDISNEHSRRKWLNSHALLLPAFVTRQLR
jgi:hypothetical protein